MKQFFNFCALAGAAFFLAACNTTGSHKMGVTSSVSTHINMSDRSMMAYATGNVKGQTSKTTKRGFKLAHSRVQTACLKPELVTLLRKVESILASLSL